MQCLASLLIHGCLGLSESTLLDQFGQLVQEVSLTVHLYCTLCSFIFHIGLQPSDCLLSEAVCELVAHIGYPELLKSQYLAHLCQHFLSHPLLPHIIGVVSQNLTVAFPVLHQSPAHQCNKSLSTLIFRTNEISLLQGRSDIIRLSL